MLTWQECFPTISPTPTLLDQGAKTLHLKVRSYVAIHREWGVNQQSGDLMDNQQKLGFNGIYI